jgi:3-phosphoshikimate 1-carboxyvinyltransferase
MPNIYTVSYHPVTNNEATIFLPASKSISNRLLIIKALSGYLDNLHNLSEADDTLTLLEIIKNVNRPEHNAKLGGTTFRFLLAYLALLRNEFILTAEGEMLNRPINELVEVLNTLGADIEYINDIGKPPVRIKRGNMHGGKITVDASKSSQFVSAVMLISPYLQGGVTIVLKGKTVSQPYIEMTANLMREFGADVNINFPEITIKEGKYTNKTYFVENDWSAASYIYQSFLFSGKPEKIKIPYLYKNSIQGDAITSKIYTQFGIDTTYLDDAIILIKQKKLIRTNKFTYNFNNNPDLAQTLAVTCSLLKIPSELQGLQTLLHKETNRINALQLELKKLNVQSYYNKSTHTLTLEPEKLTPPKTAFLTYNDHRMAMAFSAVAQIFRQIKMENPDVVTKSFPSFWKEIEKFGVILER